MVIKINEIEYRLASDYEISEQVGATAVMTANLLLEGKDVPQPFDRVEVDNGGSELGFDDFSGGLRYHVAVDDDGLRLAIDPDINDAWNMWAGLTWEDIAI